MRLSVSELLASGACSWTGDGWRPILHRGLGEAVLLADQRGAECTLTCVQGVAGLWLLRHRWSGIAKVSCGSRTDRVSLTSDVQDLNYIVPLDVPSTARVEIKITVDCEAQTPKSYAQVWLLGLAFNKLPMADSKAQTLSSTTRLISGEWGRFLVLVEDTEIPTGILNAGSWAPNDIEVFKRQVNPGDCVLDIGAHVGHHSVVLSKLVGISGRVLSIEAQRLMYQLLNANCVINGALNVQPVHLVASDHPHVARLYPKRLAGNNLGSLGVIPCLTSSSRDEGEIVDAGCVDDLVERYCAGQRIAFIKIDVQAYEKYALLGLMRTITKDRPRIYFEVCPYWMQRVGYDYRDIYQLLRTMGYGFEHFISLPLTSHGVPDVPLNERAEWNCLAIPPSEEQRA